MYFCNQEELFDSNCTQIAEIRNVAKSLPPLRWNRYKSLILSYSADFSVFLMENRCMLLYRRCYVAVMKNSYSEPCILFYKLRNNNLSLYYRKWFWPEMTLTKWPESWGLTFNVVKISSQRKSSHHCLIGFKIRFIFHRE